MLEILKKLILIRITRRKKATLRFTDLLHFREPK